MESLETMIEESERLIDEHELENKVDDIDSLRAQIQHLELQNRRQAALGRLQIEALRAGLQDLDALALAKIPTESPELIGDGFDPAEVIENLKRSKPYLFKSKSISENRPPVAQSLRSKHASDMTDAEYKRARALLIGRNV